MPAMSHLFLMLEVSDVVVGIVTMTVCSKKKAAIRDGTQ
jgi:hypothetical protein